MKHNRLVAAALAVLFALGLSAGSAFAAAKPAPAGKVNINTATARAAQRRSRHRREAGRAHRRVPPEERRLQDRPGADEREGSRREDRSASSSPS